MKALLIQKGLWNAVEASGPTSQASGDSQKALALILLNVKDHHLNTVAACKSAKEAWEALAGIYQSQLNARRMTLRKELTLLKMKPGEALTVYFARARTLWTDLVASGLTINESEVVFSALSGLPHEYNTAVAIVTTTSQGALKLDVVMAQLLQVEAQLRTDKEETPEVMLARAKGHAKPHSSLEGKQKVKGTCYYCGKVGHYAKDCRKKKSDEEKKKHAQAGSSVVLTVSNTNHSGAGVWTLDSGAQRHITPHPELLSDVTPLDHPITVVFGNKTTGTGYVEGNVVFNTITAGVTREVKLSHVLLVPECTMGNLLSVKQATKRGAVVMFESSEECKVLVNGTAVMEGRSRGDDLYHVRGTPVMSPEAVAGVTKQAGSPQLWHRRFGHLGYDNLAVLVKQDMVNGLPVPANEFEAVSKEPCEPCIMAKHARKPFPASMSGKASKPLELVHMDVCGPVSPPSRGGARYLATFLDDYSGLSAVKFLSSKADVAATVQEVLSYLESQSGTKVMTVRTDRGSEYLNHALTTYFKSKGIRHETTAPYTPQQNGAAERLNRTLFDRTRAMLEDAHLPKDLWAEAASTANYIRNRSPTSSRPKTPWELFYGKKPDVAHMRTFGSVAYARVPDKLRKKLDPKSLKGVFVGYEPTSKAYRVLLDSGKLVVSRDVIFHESPAVTPMSKWELDATRSEEGSECKDTEPPAADNPPNKVPPPPPPFAEALLPRYVAVEPRELPSDESRYPKRDRGPPPEWWAAKRHHVAVAVATEADPNTLEEALNRSDADLWRQAMDEELVSLYKNKTWTLDKLPDGATAVPVKWVFKIKRDAAGNIERYKARLVAKGYMQREGVDYTDVFAPTSKHTTLRALLALVAAHDMELHQLDVKTAFLNGELEEDIYMAQPPGYEQGEADTVCHLHKALYGLKQAPRAWHMRLKKELEAMGFTASQADPGLYVKQGAHAVYLLVYVDDFLVASKSLECITEVKSALSMAFDIKDLGEAKYFLGITIERHRAAKTLAISQKRMTTELIHKYGMEDAKPKTVPLSSSTRLSAGDEDETLDTKAMPYSELVGSLLYLSVCTRPDITQAVGALARYMAHPKMAHWNAAKGVLSYLAGTKEAHITFEAGNTELLGYCDADYAGDIDTRRSTTGYVFLLNGGAISWSSRLQPTVAASTTEAEYMAAAHAVKEALWLRKLMTDFNKLEPGPVRIKTDNQAALSLLKYPISSMRSKHIDVIHHFARERVARGEVTFDYVPTTKMIADMMTKALPEGKHTECCHAMGMHA